MPERRAAARYRVLVTDLDQTLYDWMAPWEARYETLLDGLVRMNRQSRETIEARVREAHRRAGSSEPPDLLERLHADGLTVWPGAAALAARAQHAAARALRLQPGVDMTLRDLRRAGVTLIGYTASAPWPTARRCRQLGLDALLDRIVCTPAPADRRPGYPEAPGRLRTGLARSRKPDPAVLQGILELLGVQPQDAAVVGDSIRHDIAMANAAGVAAIWAAYGETSRHPAWNLLERVTHWPAHAVRNARTVPIGPGAPRPDHVLEHRFSDIRRIVLDPEDG